MSAHPPGTKAAKLRVLSVDRLQRGDYQPRRVIDGTGLSKLAESIRAKGVLQPVFVRKGRHGKFEIVAGERRWHAACIAGLKAIPTVVSDVSDEAALAIGLIENLHREDLNPIDQARAMSRLVEEFGMTHQEVADTIGKSRAAVSNLIRLLDLAPAVCEMVANGELDMGHGRALLALPPDEQEAAAAQVLARQWSVREVEAWVRRSRDASGDEAGEGGQVAERGDVALPICEQKDGRYQVSFSFGTADELERAIGALRLLSTTR